jgi:hypothetical protein
MAVATASVAIVTAGRRPAYEIPLAVCTKAVWELRLRTPSGEFDTHRGIAGKAGCDQRQVSSFFNGHPVSLPVARKIVAAIGLTFAEVARPHGAGSDGG